jgi:flagellar biosynthetic protein FliO
MPLDKGWGRLNQLADTSHSFYQPDLWTAGLKTFGTLCIVIGILIVVLFFVKRFLYRDSKFGQGQLLKMLSSYHVGPKQRIALIDVAGEKLVIGITPENLTCLTKIENADQLARIELSQAHKGTGSGFDRFFRASLGGKDETVEK